jgi:hypothetical protein
MKSEKPIDLITVEAELVQEFARALESKSAPDASDSSAGWTDTFRASGSKHA